MLPLECSPNRRTLLMTGLGFAAGLGALSSLALPHAASAAAPDNSWIIGPQPGYTPEVGTLVSMLAFTRDQVLNNVKGFTQPQLDFLIDAKANTIGALLMHLAATETYYQLNTFDNIEFGKWPEDIKKKWDIPMHLDQPARDTIKGHDLDYYVDALNQARAKTLAELKKRDDKWLATVDNNPDWPANNYAKWFHVAEHESNHDGQIKFLKSRVPGAKPAAE
jgi:Protein of unknown function (DUF664)